MDYFNDVLTTFLGLDLVSCVAVYAGSKSYQISSKIYSAWERAQRTANRKNTYKLSKQLPQFYNARAANAHNSNK